MTTSTRKNTTADSARATAKSGRYYPTTAKATEKARETYRAVVSSLGKAVPKIH
jgi:hypothetical protein